MPSTGRADRAQAYVLSAPWALFDVHQDRLGTGRLSLSPGRPAEIAAGTPLFLAAPEGARVSIEGRRLGVQQETRAFDLGPRRYLLFSLSIGTREEDARMVVRLDDRDVGQVRIRGHLPRPSWSQGRTNAPTDWRQERLDLFLLGLVDLIRLADDPAVARHESGWDRLLHAWSSDEIGLTEPPMALIVRHARTLRRLLNDLGRHPRRILSRTRSMTPIDRVQQLDVSSVRWLSRQPGETVYQRAGPEQRILAVQRYEDLDTLENRVLRDLAARSNELATAYTEQYRALQASARWELVDGYRRDSQRLARNLRHDDIGLPHPPIIPNYALLQDRRYRRVWRAYREIIRRIDEQDECWRWQHRLWADFCRLAVQVALKSQSNFQTLAESPLRIAQEQQRGRWSLVDAHSGVFLLKDQQGKPTAVISVLWDTTAEHPKLSTWMSGLGAAAVFHLQSLHDGAESYLLLWPMHLFGDDELDMSRIAASCERALDTCLKAMKLSDNVDIRAEGLVLISNFDTSTEIVGPNVKRAGRVVAARLNANLGNVRQDIENLSGWLHGIAHRLVGQTEPTDGRPARH